jgi:hypothetical protein
VLLLAAAGEAHAYPWTLKPFYRQRPIGGSFGDLRMVSKRKLGDGGLSGPGRFCFHNGIDIHGRPRTRSIRSSPTWRAD